MVVAVDPKSGAVGVATMLRRTLKEAFPHTTFRIRKKSYDAVTVHWEDGPTTSQVRARCNQHEYGHFDGMIDLYESDNRRDDIPQCKYVLTERSMSKAAFIAAIEWVNTTFGYEDIEYEIRGEGEYEYVHVTNDRHVDGRWLSHLPNQYSWQFPLLCPDDQHPILLTDRFCPTCGCAIPRHDPNDYTHR
jgi:hypothetical protein